MDTCNCSNKAFTAAISHTELCEMNTNNNAWTWVHKGSQEGEEFLPVVVIEAAEE